MKTQKLVNVKEITSVSTWIAAGHIQTGYWAISEPTEETEKAICFEVMKWNSLATKQYKAKCWFPKKYIKSILNDYYVNIKGDFYLVPEWLCESKRAEGFEI